MAFHLCVSDPITFATNLNHFYARFDTSDFSAECDSLLNSLPFQELDYESLLNKQDVYFQLIKFKLNKAPGPDGCRSGLEKLCPGINSYSSFSFSSITLYFKNTGHMEIINRYSCPQKITSIRVKPLQAGVVNLNYNEML